jgi:hypothetical protein
VFFYVVVNLSLSVCFPLKKPNKLKEIEMNFRNYRRKIVSIAISGLLAGAVSAVSPSATFAITPVGDSNSIAWATNGTPQNLQIATINSASAIAVSDNTATAAARSVGLAVTSARSASATGQTATVQLGGVLSLYTLSATSTALVANGGTFSSAVAAGYTKTLQSQPQQLVLQPLPTQFFGLHQLQLEPM